MNWRRWRVPALWAVCIVLAAAIVVRARFIADLSAFLPANPSAVQRLLVDQLRDGPASRLILAAIERGDPGTRARLMSAMAGRLRGDPQFTSINDGAAPAAQRDLDRSFLFRHRYLLSDQVAPARFSADGLHEAISNSLDDLASPAGLLLKSLLPSDPTGEMLHILDGLERLPAPATRDGVWMSADGARTLMVAQTAAGGSDTDAQERAIRTIHAAFSAALRGAPAAAITPQLRLSGPGVFAVEARANIERAALRLSMLGALMVVTLLFAVYRSVRALGLGLLPVASGALVGVAAVAQGFGVVHGITLGFGITLIGESVDYSIYFFVAARSARRGAAPASWERTWWPTVRLGMLTSVCGFASLLPSGFPGLAQLGAYSISGLIAAAMVTRFVLPALSPANLVIHDVTPLGAHFARWLAPVRRVPGPVLALAWLGVAILCLTVLQAHRSHLWNRDLAALSPVPAADQQYDAALRRDLGAADVRDLVVVTAPTLDAALAGSERAARALQPLVDSGTIGAFDAPSNYLPSLSAQNARRASLPAPAQLRVSLARAAAGLGVRIERLQPFLDDVDAARHGPPITEQDLRGTSLRAGFDALILRQPGRVEALLPLHAPPGRGGIDTGRLSAALHAAHLDDARVLDLKQQTDALYAQYLSEALRLSLAGFASLIVLLLVALRSALRVARVLAPLLLAVLCVTAGLALCGVELTLLHLVGMLLIVAVGSNYALFFDRQTAAHDADNEPLTLASLAIANASTVIGFGLLSFSGVPVLTALGASVAPGALLALLFSALLSRA